MLHLINAIAQKTPVSSYVFIAIKGFAQIYGLTEFYVKKVHIVPPNHWATILLLFISFRNVVYDFGCTTIIIIKQFYKHHSPSLLP